MTDSNAQFDGLSEMLSKLDALPEIVKNGAVRGALQAGCEVLAAAARQFVPVAPPNKRNAERYGAVMGSLRNSIKVLPVDFNGTWANCKVSAGSKVAYYARWVEFGTAAHYIKASQGKDVQFGDVIRKGFQHPGATKHPFMRPALDTAGQEAINRFGEYLKRRIDVESLAEMESAG